MWVWTQGEWCWVRDKNLCPIQLLLKQQVSNSRWLHLRTYWPGPFHICTSETCHTAMQVGLRKDNQAILQGFHWLTMWQEGPRGHSFFREEYPSWQWTDPIQPTDTFCLAHYIFKTVKFYLQIWISIFHEWSEELESLDLYICLATTN